ncbi:MAG: YtxH domain-containing protein [Patescibacteria group bacterium]
MKKSTINKLKIVDGALIGAALGFAAGMMLSPESGKDLREDIKSKSADFYKLVSSKIKKIKKMTEKEYKAFIEKAVETYGITKKLSVEEKTALVKTTRDSWKHFKKHF